MTEAVSNRPALPLVSILIPTHNRPDYLEIALRSALAQTYKNIEIIVSDNSDDDASQARMAPFLIEHSHIKYLRSHGTNADQNFSTCLEQAAGEYVNFLMDDDVFHPEKIQRMVACYLGQPEIGMVTSCRQLIDGDGHFLAPLPGTEPLFPQDTRIGGKSLGDLILSKGMNLIGESTTVLLRRSDIAQGFGWFCGRQFSTLSDVATWLSLLAHKDCVYLTDKLSYFRLHSGQDQRTGTVRITAQIEWVMLACLGHSNHLFLDDQQTMQSGLSSKLNNYISFIVSQQNQIREGPIEVEAIKESVCMALDVLLANQKTI